MREAERSSRALRRIELTTAVIATAVVLSFHFVFLSSAGALWRDEVNTVAFATMPSLGEIWTALEHDSVPLASTLAVRLWTAVAPATDPGLRVFGVLVGIGFLLAAWTGARLLGSSAPLIAVALLGFNPVVVRYVDSLRPYGLGTVFILLTLGLVWHATRSPTPGRLALACLFAVLGVQTLYPNALLLGAICLGGAAVALRRSGWMAAARPLAIGLVAALSLVPYSGVLVRSRETLVVAEAPVGWSWIWAVVKQALGSEVGFTVWLWLVLMTVCILGVVHAQVAGRRSRISAERRDLALYCGIVMVVGTAIFFLFIRSANVPTQPWYYLPLMAVVAMSIEGIVASLAGGARGRLGRLLLLGLVAVTMTVGTWRAVRVRQTNVDHLASFLEKQATKEDLIVVSPWFCGVTFQWYYAGSAPWMANPPIEDLTIHRYDLLREKMISHRPLDPLLSGIEKTLRSGGHVWLVGAPGFMRSGLPPVLPPAPHPATGWQNLPYVRAWTMQVGYFLQSHAGSIDVVPVPSAGPVSAQENLRLLVAKGWRARGVRSNIPTSERF